MRLWIVLALAAVVGFVIYQSQGVQAPAVVTSTPDPQSIPLPPAPTRIAKKKKVFRAKPVVEEAKDDVQPEAQQEEVQAQQQLPEALKFTPSQRHPDGPKEYILRSSETVRPDVNHPLITLTYGQTDMKFENRDVSTKTRSGFLADGD